MGFHDDSVPAVVLQVCNELSDDGSKLADEEREVWEGKVFKFTCPVFIIENLKRSC